MALFGVIQVIYILLVLGFFALVCTFLVLGVLAFRKYLKK